MSVYELDIQKIEQLLNSATSSRQRKMYQALLDKARSQFENSTETIAPQTTPETEKKAQTKTNQKTETKTKAKTTKKLQKATCKPTFISPTDEAHPKSNSNPNEHGKVKPESLPEDEKKVKLQSK